MIWRRKAMKISIGHLRLLKKVFAIVSRRLHKFFYPHIFNAQIRRVQLPSNNLIIANFGLLSQWTPLAWRHIKGHPYGHFDIQNRDMTGQFWTSHNPPVTDHDSGCMSMLRYCQGGQGTTDKSQSVGYSNSVLTSSSQYCRNIFDDYLFKHQQVLQSNVLSHFQCNTLCDNHNSGHYMGKCCTAKMRWWRLLMNIRQRLFVSKSGG